ncbi:MAG: ester cyclase [Woeseiaceae bacterium]|nr:ester cyclase [Woeseiaceae bacterium]
MAIVFSALVISACESKVTPDDGASEALAAAEAKIAEMANYDAHIAAADAWIEAWDSGVVDGLDAVAHSSYTRTAPDFNAGSLDELKAFIQQVHQTYPDFSITNDGMAAGPDGVFLQWTVTGTDTGRGENATGNSMQVTGISRMQFSDGKVARELVIFDTGTALTQLDTAELPHTAN